MPIINDNDVLEEAKRLNQKSGSFGFVAYQKNMNSNADNMDFGANEAKQRNAQSGSQNMASGSMSGGTMSMNSGAQQAKQLNAQSGMTGSQSGYSASSMNSGAQQAKQLNAQSSMTGSQTGYGASNMNSGAQQAKQLNAQSGSGYEKFEMTNSTLQSTAPYESSGIQEVGLQQMKKSDSQPDHSAFFGGFGSTVNSRINQGAQQAKQLNAQSGSSSTSSGAMNSTAQSGITGSTSYTSSTASSDLNQAKKANQPSTKKKWF